MPPLINSKYSAVVKSLDYQRLTADINEELNIDRLKTMYFGFDGDREIEIRFVDPRGFSAEQRRFVYALLGDIYAYTGEPIESLKDYFWSRYEALTGREISLKDVSTNTMEDVGLLADIILDFIFEWDIPFKNGYEILPVNQEYYFYKCCTTRKCFLCGKKADIHHYEAVGMGNNRKHHDHTKHTFMALCREHHQEIHRLGGQNFCNKYQVKPISLNAETLKRLGV